MIFLLASYFYGILFWIIRFSLKTRKNGEIFSVFFISIIHGVLFQGVAVPILLDLMTTKTNQYLSAAVNILTAPMIIFIILSWVFIHLKFFYFPLSTIEKNLKIISEGIKNGLYRSQTLNNLHSSVWWRLFNRKINIIASIITGTVYSYCEINLWLFIKDEAVKDSNINTTLLTITLALLILNPLFLMLGISIVVSPFRNSNKFLYTPLFCGALPMIGLLPLYSYISSYIELQELGKVIFFGFPSGVFFWMTLILTGIRRKHIFYSAITILCLFILLPFAYFAPLNEEKAFEQNEIIKVLIYVLGFMGVGLFAILLLVLIWIYVLKRFKENKLEKTNSFNLAVYIIANLKDCGFWFNAVFFMISFIALSYSIYYHPSSTSVISTGTVINFNNIIFKHN